MTRKIVVKYVLPKPTEKKRREVIIETPYVPRKGDEVDLNLMHDFEEIRVLARVDRIIWTEKNIETEVIVFLTND